MWTLFYKLECNKIWFLTRGVGGQQFSDFFPDKVGIVGLRQFLILAEIRGGGVCKPQFLADSMCKQPLIHKDKQTEIWTQTDSPTDRKRKKTGWQTHRGTDGQTDVLTDRSTERPKNVQTNRLTEHQTHIPKDWYIQEESFKDIKAYRKTKQENVHYSGLIVGEEALRYPSSVATSS